MSRYFSARHASLEAYTPGEQPLGKKYIKLNTNESPYSPSPSVLSSVLKEAERLQLYSDPECRELNRTAAEFLGVSPRQILMTNGSDDALNFAFLAFGDESHPFAFPSVTYGFYPVFAKLNRVPYKEIPLREDFSVNPADYENIGMNIVLANPNAPTGLALSVDEIEKIVRTNPDHVVVIDEAYIDFSGETCLPLIEKYDNLLVTRTFSKFYSLAGARLGFCVGAESLVADLTTVKDSTNPYNVNRMTMAAGIAALTDDAYYRENGKRIVETRERVKKSLRRLGFSMTDSKTNFLFVTHPKIGGTDLYLALKNAGILVRHFSLPALEPYNRITIGSEEEMDALLSAVEIILKKDKTE